MTLKYHRRVIKITAEDSPNVRRARFLLHTNPQMSRSQVAAQSVLVPNVLTLDELEKRLATWDEMRICVGLKAEFYEGVGLKLFPVAWLNHAQDLYRRLLQANTLRRAKAIGIDPAEGGDRTTMAAVDERGLLEMVSKPTPDTSVVTAEVIAFGRRHGVPPEKWYFDRGGGGKQHADRLRAQGYKGVQTVAFGESVQPAPRSTAYRVSERVEMREKRYTYFNRRAELYGETAERLDPASPTGGYALPPASAGEQYAELLRQLSLIPLEYDDEGRLRLRPKGKANLDRRGSAVNNQAGNDSLIGLIGHSPDEADAFTLAVWGTEQRERRGRLVGISL